MLTWSKARSAIAAEMNRQRINRTELANRSGGALTRSTLDTLFTGDGEKGPTFATLAAILAALGVSLTWLGSQLGEQGAHRPPAKKKKAAAV